MYAVEDRFCIVEAHSVLAFLPSSGRVDMVSKATGCSGDRIWVGWICFREGTGLLGCVGVEGRMG